MPSSRSHLIHRPRERGFTVLEVMVALTLLSVLLLAAFVVFNTAFAAYLRGKDFTDEHQNARFVMEWMVRRIRLAGLGVSSPPFFTQASGGAVAFLGDTNGDGTPEWHRFCLETSQGVVRHEMAATDLGTTTCTTSTGAPITSRGMRPVRVVLLEFAYFPLGEDPLATGISRVRIRLALDTNRSGGYESASDLTLELNAVVRN